MFFATLAALSLQSHDPNPRLADADRFPSAVADEYGGEADVPAAQANLCQDLHDRLEFRWRVHPWSAARERDLEALLRSKLFWELLIQARDAEWSDDFRLGRLLRLQQMLGPEDYRRGAHPPLLTAEMLPPVPDPVAMPPAD